jgi:uncharacterized protein
MLQLPPYPIAGLDYGSKLAGTSVLALLQPEGKVELFCSTPKRDADAFLMQLLLEHSPRRVFIDAPLSLPGVYQKLPGYSDFFYRRADRALRAMSPLFLGGLTARAMQLNDKMIPHKIQFLETYPAGWVRFFGTDVWGYRAKGGDPELFCKKLTCNSPFLTRLSACTTWHHADALISLLSGLRYENQTHSTFGAAEEGEIVI